MDRITRCRQVMTFCYENSLQIDVGESELDTLLETAGSTDKCAGLSYSKTCQPKSTFHEVDSNEDLEVDKYKPDISACMVERKVASLDDCCCIDEEGSPVTPTRGHFFYYERSLYNLLREY
ncbi:uncharacterized protein LOC117103855 [Anneissia japonica]|uniref:uncharacterized protein LOC117103855 n=1 Tax=Anneissia japonica TaxID=1529436 RepID=UPI0014258A22|nr:uncharacterized protein LOC117103855 [Anneissia japonica]